MAVDHRHLLLLALLLASSAVARAEDISPPQVPRFEPAPCPKLAGAEELAKASCFYLVVPAAILLVASFFVPGGAAASGWTLYPPLVMQQGVSVEDFDRRRNQDFWQGLVDDIPAWDRMIQEFNAEVGGKTAA